MRYDGLCIKQTDKLKLAVVYELIISNPSPQVIHSLAKRHHSEAASLAERHHGEATSLFPQIGNFQFIAQFKFCTDPLAPPLGELSPKATERAVGITDFVPIS